jgi:hypothetical protein
MGLWSQAPEAIVKKCVEALGGEEAIKKHLDFSGEGDFSLSLRGMELAGDFKLIQKDKKLWNKIKVTFAGNEVTQTMAFDGKKAWMERMGNIADQPSLNYESDQDHSLELLVEKNAVFTAAKETEIEGKKVIGIEADFKGKKTTFFIDPDTYTPMEIVYKDYYYGMMTNVKELMEKRQRLMDYKRVDGVFFPTKMITYQKGQKFMELRFNKVLFNPKVPADIFERPDQEADLRYMEEILH